MYLVDKETLVGLVQDSLLLAALEGGGVDNWEWYGYSIQDALEEWKIILGLDEEFSFKDIATILVERNYKTND